MALTEIVMSHEDASKIDATNIRQLYSKFAETLRYRELLFNEYEKQKETETALLSDTNYSVFAPIARYATNLAAGYFIGKPCKYYSRITQTAKETELSSGKRVEITQNNEADAGEREIIDAYLAAFRAVLRRNHEDEENMTLARDCLIHRVAFERIYTMQDKGLTDIRFKAVDPKCCVLIKDDSIERNPVAFIGCENFVDPFTNATMVRYELITRDRHRFFEFPGTLNPTGGVPHGTDMYDDMVAIREYDADEASLNLEKIVGIPIVEYRMPEDKGFYEDVIPLIKARDALLNNMRNTFKYNDEAILMMIGYMRPSTDADMQKLRDELENFKMLFLGEDNKVQWLLKEVPMESVAGWYNILSQDIFAMLGIKNPVKQSEVYQNITTVRYQNYGMENTIAGMERTFERSLLEGRAQKITNVLNFLLKTEWDWEVLDVAFERNLPTSRTEEAQFMAQMKAANVLADEDILDQVSFVEDTDAAIIRKMKQDERQAEQSVKVLTRATANRQKADPNATLEEDVTNDRKVDKDDGRLSESR